jgi:hypothetical protein
VKDGSVHFFNIIKRSRYLPQDLRTLIDESLKTNFFFAHSENVLLAMLGNQLHRQRALDLIIAIRSKPKHNEKKNKKTLTNIRPFCCPEIKFAQITSESNDFTAMIDLKPEKLFEPPITMNLSIAELNQFKVPTFPCHAQATERCVKLVSESSQKVIGQQNRHGVIVNTIYSRKTNQTFKSKQDYSTFSI